MRVRLFFRASEIGGDESPSAAELAEFGYFVAQPKPDARDLPEMPDITPYVPTPPKMPDLPPEIPWPPSVDWPDIPPWVPPDFPPWDFGDDGGMGWYADFARRLMALIIATAVHRSQLGEVPGYPAFDLRSMGSFIQPGIVNLAVLWFVTIWNTHPIVGTPVTGEEVFVEASLDDGYILPPSDFAYDANLVVSRTHGSGMVFRGLNSVPTYATVASAYLHVTAAAVAIGTGVLTLRVRGQRGIGAFTNTFASIDGRRSIAEPTYDEWIIGAVAFGDNITIDVTAVVQALVNSPAWAHGCTLFIDDFDEVTDPAVTRRIELYSFDTGGNIPSLAVVTGTGPHGAEMVSPVYVNSFSKAEVGKLMAWLSAVEGICWPHLREKGILSM